ncbi:hypothetical protein HELRODRAFT_187353 [Helobdella robusta]|uniref:Vinculin n=1 Tax=Helobdella robusta TaxID=6412 RepID=T1FP92_HELRO|nr:hypothetical protein HELRODRAFT_187353 [Helobdella robusta]ESN97209.1 hypothetical protein HELRODRAFT_187353 [Helobdella robusta]
MPVFHTKTIESILEPVAQQVSKLVILHEEAEDGNAMPDLTRPVQVVKMAVDNLIKVGYETINNSEDEILKQDMPPSLTRVEESCMLLVAAAEMLKDDPLSPAARKKLIEGSRGILQGTSGLLLAFDESEVRKIIGICKNVLEYLDITEVVESLEDLVTFVKNLSPVLTKMAKEVDSREKELTHQVHREWLQRSLNQVKQLTPALISSIKIFVTTKNQGGAPLADALSSRNYVTSKMAEEVHEIIRVLQLTTYDEEEWDDDDITVMKKAQNGIDNKMRQAQDWLSDPEALVGSAGEHAVRNILDYATRVADRSVSDDDREAICKSVSNVASMMDALCELRSQGQGNSTQAHSLSRGIQQILKDLQDRCQKSVIATDRSNLRKPAHTILGKLEQADRWIANPSVDDNGLGRFACKQIAEDGVKLVENMPNNNKRSDMLQLCKEVNSLTEQLDELSRRGQGSSPQARQTAIMLAQKLNQLKNKIQQELVEKVADHFLDISTPLKLLSDAANAPFGTANRQQTFEDRLKNFTEHSRNMVSTAKQLARSGACNDRRTVEGLVMSAQIVEDLQPQLTKAARIVLNDPTNQASTEHFDLLKKQWMGDVERLRGLADEAIDTDSFIRENEEAILRETDRTEHSASVADSTGVVSATSSIARRAHRVLQVAQSEADNSEDPRYVDNIQHAVGVLKNDIAPMIQTAKGLAQNPHNAEAANQWRSANQQLIDSVSNVRLAVNERGGYPKPPDISRLYLSDYQDSHPPPIPPPPHEMVPPRPPPPTETDDEFETSFPIPQSNQPIMMAAHALHMDVKQWSSRDNDLIVSAKRMALLMAKLSQLVRGEGGTKKDLIDCARSIAEASEEVTALAKQLAHECTDKRMRMNLLQVCERIPTIGTQLKILSTVKATMLGAQGSDEDQEATEMLVGNAQNLMQSVRETVQCAEAASIKIRVDSGYSIKWIRKRPWYA